MSESESESESERGRGRGRERRSLLRRVATPAGAARAFATLSVTGMVLSVAGVASLAIAAELIGGKTWGAYFAMERAMALGTPVAVAFTGLSVLGGFAVVATASAGVAESERGADPERERAEPTAE